MHGKTMLCHDQFGNTFLANTVRELCRRRVAEPRSRRVLRRLRG